MPKAAADIVAEDAQLVWLDAHGAGDLAAHGGDALGAAAQRELVDPGVIARGRGARLERGDDQALIDKFDAHDMRGVLEGAIERRLLLAVGIGRRGPVEPDIAGRIRPKLRRAGFDGIARVGDGVERLVIDDDFFGGVLRGARARPRPPSPPARRHAARASRRATAGAARPAPCRRGRGSDADARSSDNAPAARSAAVSTATTPGALLAAATSIRSIVGEGVRRAHETGGQAHPPA